MNLNDYSEDLKIEEQSVLNRLISEMDQVIDRLDQTAKDFVDEAKNIDISQNPDEYISLLLARKGLKDTSENRKRMLQARDELYQYRLLLQCQDLNGTEIQDLKIGLHSCMDGNNQFVISWTMPLCRHYVLDNSSLEFENVVTGIFGEKFHTNYKLLVKNEVKLRFTRVKEAINLFPRVMDDKTLMALKGSNFFSDSFLDQMIDRFNRDEYNPDEATKIIYDEFLKELLERRSTPELKNIVFSIQKKQGEIIQAPYNRNMVVQGCAGSGKSMIMLHRIPILLYDNPSNLSRTNLYVITPSQMYIQLAENMRHQLEISDISMGTIEQYYDYCISKYLGCKPQDYGKIDFNANISSDDEQYIFSSQCLDDIKDYYEKVCSRSNISLEKAYSVLAIKDEKQRVEDTYTQRINTRILKIQSIINANESVLSRYYKKIRNTIDAFNDLDVTLRDRKDKALREIAKRITQSTDEIKKAKQELEKLDITKNAVAIEYRNNKIETANNQLVTLNSSKSTIEADDEYFASLLKINEKLKAAVVPFKAAKNEYSQIATDEIYTIIDNAGALIGAYFMLSWELSKVEDKYLLYLDPIRKDIEKAEQAISALRATTDKYLDLDYYKAIREEGELLISLNENAVKEAYEFVLAKLDCTTDKSGNVHAIKYSPYLYLQTIYLFRGLPTSGIKETLLAIDEAQGLAPEELRLLKNINGNKVIMNLYGDVYQHIEGTKGIDSWDEFKAVIDFDIYEMQENYRNASQITDYCNRVFEMNMKAINTPGKGVHEISNKEEFQTEVISQLVDSKRAGIGAILVADDKEAKFLMEKFSAYEQKFHNMTGEEFSLHRTRWNIMNINVAKGLEFSSVIVLTGRMSRNQKYIAYTRALDDLYIYSEPVDLSDYIAGDLPSHHFPSNQATNVPKKAS